MNNKLKDVLEACVMLLRDRKFEDIAISGGTCLSSIKNFSSVEEMIEYINMHNAKELLVRKNGKYRFSERMYMHRIIDVKLNEKSVTFLTNSRVAVGNKMVYNYNIRF